jgi:hypothetical protein
MGRLVIKADPPALSISISGPEFATNLQDGSGGNLAVPTDLYTVNAQYQRWPDSKNVSITENAGSSVTFSPHFSTVNLSCNRDGATFQLQNGGGQIIENGNLPATVSDLPAGNYQANIYYHSRTIQKPFVVRPDTTNDIPFQFKLGAVHLETKPSGAEARTRDGNYLGQTPLLLADLVPQACQITLSLSGYEPVTVAVEIAADQTNYYSTNLVGASYLPAMRDARMNLATSNFEAAAQAAGAAVSAKPGDPDALAIQAEANKYLDAKRQEQEKLQRPKKWFDSLCTEYPYTALFAEHEMETGKSASDVASGIVAALTNSPSAFKIVKTASPEPDIYQIVAKQTDFLGVNERDCLIVVGSPGDADTQIRFSITISVTAVATMTC